MADPVATVGSTVGSAVGLAVTSLAVSAGSAVGLLSAEDADVGDRPAAADGFCEISDTGEVDALGREVSDDIWRASAPAGDAGGRPARLEAQGDDLEKEWLWTDGEWDATEELDRVFGPSFAHRRKKLRAASPFGGVEGWDVRAAIVKSGDVLRQEHSCMP